MIGVFKDEDLTHEIATDQQLDENMTFTNHSSDAFVKVKVSVDATTHVAPIAVV